MYAYTGVFIFIITRRSNLHTFSIVSQTKCLQSFEKFCDDSQWLRGPNGSERCCASLSSPAPDIICNATGTIFDVKLAPKPSTILATSSFTCYIQNTQRFSMTSAEKNRGGRKHTEKRRKGGNAGKTKAGKEGRRGKGCSTLSCDIVQPQITHVIYIHIS